MLKYFLLEAHSDCFRYYKLRFDVENWPELKVKLHNLTRTSYSSRRSLRRRLEADAYRSRLRDATTVIDSLNKYRKEVSVANYRLCVLCGQFCLETSAIEIDPTDQLYQEQDLENKGNLKRLNKHWLCLLCKSTGKKQEKSFSTPFMKLISFNACFTVEKSTQPSPSGQKMFCPIAL